MACFATSEHNLFQMSSAPIAVNTWNLNAVHVFWIDLFVLDICVHSSVFLSPLFAVSNFYFAVRVMGHRRAASFQRFGTISIEKTFQILCERTGKTIMKHFIVSLI